MKKLLITSLAFLIIVLLILAAHSRSLDNHFYFDDSHIVLNNPAIRSLNNIPRFFTDITTYTSDYNNEQYRPIVTLSLALNYAIGEYNPRGYHITHLIIHFLCCVFILLISRKLFLKWTDIPFLTATILGLAAAALFAVTPQNVETINYCLCRSTSFATLFSLIAFYLYLYARKGHWSLYLVVLLCIILGLMSKDVAGSLPLLLIFYEYWEKGRKKYHNPKYTSYRQYVPWLLLIAVVVLYYIRGHVFVGDSRFESQFSGHFLLKVGTQSRAQLHYIKQFFFPGEFPIDPIGFGFTSVTHPASVLSIITLLATAVFIFAARRKFALLSFGLLWYFIAIAPSSSIAWTTQPVNYHRPYIALPGLCLATVAFLYILFIQLSSRYKRTLAYVCCSGVFFLMLGWFIHFAREDNALWNDTTALWENAVYNAPTSGRAHLNLGLEYMKKGMYDKALYHFNECVRLWPEYPYVYINLGILNRTLGNNEEADKSFEKAYSLWPRHKTIVKWYAEHQIIRGKYMKAIRALNGVVDDTPETAFLRAKRGLAYYHLKMYDKAIADITQAKQYHTLDTDTANAYAASLVNAKQYNNAYTFITEWLKTDPNNSTMLFNQAYTSMMQKKYAQALNHWKEYAKRHPESTRAQNYITTCRNALNEKQ